MTPVLRGSLERDVGDAAFQRQAVRNVAVRRFRPAVVRCPLNDAHSGRDAAPAPAPVKARRGPRPTRSSRPGTRVRSH